ncbi:MAG: tRNA epoxyqueuosine(34) reductase QueG [Bacteroidota bacterium]
MIKSEALRLGFADCGIAKASPLEEEAGDLKKWLRENRHGEMKYMENYFEKRTDPTKLVEGAESVISVIYNYYPKETRQEGTYKISKYAYGKDYHYILKDKLHSLLNFIQNNIAEVNGRAFVDTAPVMDKVWAQKAGLGWIGKNTNLITKKHGSYVFIGELIVDARLDYDTPIKDYCGNCRKCIDACPTGALTEPYRIDASRCISYLTIEKKGEIPSEFQGKLNKWIFGCDTCQDVCPWNQKVKPMETEELKPHPDLLNLQDEGWENLSREKFNELFRKSAVKRTKYEGLKRNILSQL